ncbi:hypothetical protein ACB092_10G136300 [Castanea dentata]
MSLQKGKSLRNLLAERGKQTTTKGTSGSQHPANLPPPPPSPSTLLPYPTSKRKEQIRARKGSWHSKKIRNDKRWPRDQLQNNIPFPSCTCGKCTCNMNITELQSREFVMKFLMGINESFSQVRTQILLMDHFPFVSKVYSLLIQEETQRFVSHSFNPKVESTALIAKSQTNFGVNYVGNNGNKGKDKPLCTHCGKSGHTIDKCYKLHGFPPNYKFKGKTAMAHQLTLSQPQDSSFLASPGSVKPSFTPEQYQQLLDLIGARCSPLASSVQGIDTLTTTMANVVSSNGSSMAATVTHVGTVTLSSSLILHNVLCVLSFTFNLFSVNSFTKSKPYCLVLLSDFCFIQDLTFWRTIGVGHAVEGLYLLVISWVMFSILSLLQCQQVQFLHFGMQDYAILQMLSFKS